MVEGEIVVTGSVNGQRSTLDPLRSATLAIPAREVASTMTCGLRVNWIEGTIDGADYMLNVGATVGSRWLTFSYKSRQYCIDVADIMLALVGFADQEPTATPKRAPRRRRK